MGHNHKVIGLISVGHFMSHFYILLLPPLFPVLRVHFDVSYTELGLAITAFSLTTGFTQAPIGFLVDRVGPARILLAGIVLEALAFVLVGVVASYGALIVLMIAAGLANAVYHPADYAILTRTVDPSRMARGFSVHTFAGFLGTAVAPVSVLLMNQLIGWQLAVISLSAVGFVVAALMLRELASLRGVHPRGGGSTPVEAGGPRRGLSLLVSTPVLMGLVFFTGLSVVSHGIGDFGVATLDLLFAIPLTEAGAMLSAYLFAAPAGVLMGGWVADKMPRHDMVVSGCLVVLALAVFAMAHPGNTVTTMTAALAVAGLASGLVAPSRDMMIRAVTPPGDMGKVFGFVSTGYNLGGVIAPLAFGFLLDRAEPQSLFVVIGAVSLMSIMSVVAVGRGAQIERPPTPRDAVQDTSGR